MRVLGKELLVFEKVKISLASPVVEYDRVLRPLEVFASNSFSLS
jgi:hypothetical protein